MKKILVGLFTIATVLSANAGSLEEKLVDAEINENKSYFETLGDLYKTGTLPDITKISNIAWAGRCFLKDKQNEPTNAGYMFRQKIIDAGPIAATSKAYEAFSYWLLDKAPNYFDEMDVEQVFATPGIEKVAQNARIKTDSIEIDLQTDVKSNLKISGNYLVEEISRPDGDVGPVGKVAVVTRCYYFIPDLNN